MSNDRKGQRAVLWLWYARGLGFGGLVLALQGLTISLLAPGLLSLGLAVMVIALVIGLSANRRVKELQAEGEGAAGGGQRCRCLRRVHVGLRSVGGDDAAVGRAAALPPLVRGA